MSTARYIKNQMSQDKVESKTTSVNLEKRQLDFIKAKNLNLSMIVRERIEELMKEIEAELKLL